MYCNELSEEEAKQMELFAKMRKEKCVGRGEVRTKTDGTVWVRFFIIITAEVVYEILTEDHVSEA